jgi:cytochrome c-type biogenesis protein CcmF
MSLVPWLILIGGVHMNMVAKSTGHSIRMAHLFYALTFVMILYSSFLTRSGVLGDTSVHAFTEMGLEWQLIILMSGMALIWLIPFLAQFRSIPSPKKEEKTYSREFWMFIGSLVLLFSAVIITFTTSIPVYNKIVDAAGALFGQDYSSLHRTAPLDPIDHYNRYQIWVALLIAMLSGIAQLLRYRGVAWKNYAARFTRHLGLSAALGAGLFLLTYQVIKPAFWPYIALLFALSFGIMTNAVYLLRVIRGNLRLGTSALAHMGFAIMIIGSVASGLNKQIISSNPFAMAGLGQFSEKDLLENIILLRDEPMYMNGYDVTYVGDTLRGLTRTFFINFKRQGEDGDTREDFDLDPNVLYSKDFSEVRVSNPSTKHYLTRDIFTHITSLPPSEMGLTARQSIEDSLRFEEYTVSLRDTIYTSKSYGVLQHIKLHPTHPEYERDSNDITIGLVVDFYRLGTDEVWRAEPMICLRGNLVYNFADQIDDLGIRIQLTNQAFEQLFVEEVDLSYEALKFRRGDTHEYKGYEITFVDFDRDPSHPSYQPGPQDLAVGAHFRIVNAMDTFTVDPIYVIRNYQPYNLKDLVPDLGLVFRFTHIDPNTETVTLEVAEQNFDAIRVEIAEQVPRSDYLVLQAIVFPGIKLFWLGSVMMLLSIFLAMWHRIRRS